MFEKALRITLLVTGLLFLWAQIGLGLMQWDIDRKCAQYESRGLVIFPVQYCTRTHQGTQFIASWKWVLENRPEPE